MRKKEKRGNTTPCHCLLIDDLVCLDKFLFNKANYNS